MQRDLTFALFKKHFICRGQQWLWLCEKENKLQKDKKTKNQKKKMKEKKKTKNQKKKMEEKKKNNKSKKKNKGNKKGKPSDDYLYFKAYDQAVQYDYLMSWVEKKFFRN